MMELDADIVTYMDAHGGMLTAADMKQLGYSRGMLHVYSRAGLLERYECGFYTRPGALIDDTVYMQRKFPAIIFSHESALYLHGLTERAPFRHSVTIPSTTKLPRSLAGACSCYYIAPSLHEIGLTRLRTTQGHIVRAYDAERCVCDLLRSRNRVDTECYTAALKLYFSSKEKNLHRLADYAAKFDVLNKLTPYLEVLL